MWWPGRTKWAACHSGSGLISTFADCGQVQVVGHGSDPSTPFHRRDQ
jgi:hypothetical protein